VIVGGSDRCHRGAAIFSVVLRQSTTQFRLFGRLEETLFEMFCARVIAFSSIGLAKLSAMLILASGRLAGGREISLACQKQWLMNHG